MGALGNPSWKPGTSGNPNGRQKLPDHVSRIKDHSKVEVIKAISETFLMTREELKVRTTNPLATMAELLIGSIMIKAIETGDPVRSQVLLNYVVGRPEPYTPPEHENEEDRARDILNSIPSSALVEVLRAQANAPTVSE